MCLNDTGADRVPTTRSEKCMLEEAGLGEKILTIPLDSSAQTFSKVLSEAYPKLKDGGGYELLRCECHSRDLVVIPQKIAASPRLLKQRVANGKVYVRPIQRDLSLEPEIETEEDAEGVSLLLFISSAKGGGGGGGGCIP